MVVFLIFEDVEIGLFLTVEDIEYIQTPTHLVDLIDLHRQSLTQFYLIHNLQKPFRIRIFPNLQFFAEAIDYEFD